MSHEAPFETAGAPDGEYRYPHHDPTITEAWEGYERSEGATGEQWSGIARNVMNQSDRLFRSTQEQLVKLKRQLDDNRQVYGTPELKAGMQEEINMIRDKINNDEVKRWSALVGGGFLALFGLRRSLGSLGIMGFGAGLAYYALTGRSPLTKVSQLMKHESGSTSHSYQATGSSLDSSRPLAVQSILVKAPLDKVYQAWSNFQNFPHFMHHIKSVSKTGDTSSHWMMEGPFHTRLEWDAEMTRDEENKRIAWSSTGGDIKTSGQVTFNALPDEVVEVTVMLKYVPPAGLAGDIFARLLSDPETKLAEDLRNFKRYIEENGHAEQFAGQMHSKPNGNKQNGRNKAQTGETKEPVTA